MECSKPGQIKKLLFFARHAAGVDYVSLRNAEEAGYYIQTLDGRWFDGHEIIAHAGDGITDYRVEEASGERES